MTTLIPQGHQATIAEQGCRLMDIPDSIFSHLVAVVSEGHGRETLHAWLAVVLHNHQDIVNNAYQQQAQDTQPPEHRTVAGNANSLPTSERGKYVCQRCEKHLKNAKDFIRHAEQTCEVVREWRCEQCAKTYKRRERFRKHHKESHACSRGDCTHDLDAEVFLPQRAALGCGFCTTCFQSNLRGFLKHLITHYEQGKTFSGWSVTTNVQSLLQQSNVLPLWIGICEKRFCGSRVSWPAMSWTADNAKHLIHRLEHDISGGDLYFCLQELLEFGLGGQPYGASSVNMTPNNHPQLPMSNPYSYDEVWTDYGSSNFGFGGTGYGFDQSSGITSPTSAATLVNVEDLWEAKFSPTNHTFDFKGLPGTGTGSSSPPSFKPAFINLGDTMDLDITNSTQDSFQSTSTISSDPFFEQQSSGIVERNILPDFDKINTAGFSPNPLSLASITNGSTGWPTHANNIGGVVNERIPPFNATLPLKEHKGHKRSTSGSIWRLLQLGLPSLPIFH